MNGSRDCNHCLSPSSCFIRNHRFAKDTRKTRTSTTAMTTNMLSSADTTTNMILDTTSSIPTTVHHHVAEDSIHVMQQLPPVAVDVLGPSDLLYGTLIAFALALMGFFLQGTRNGRHNFAILDSNLNAQNTNTNTNTNANTNTNTSLNLITTGTIPIITRIGSDDLDNSSNRNNNTDTSAINSNTTTTGSTVFDGKSWKEMSKPESYIFYNRRIKQQQQRRRQKGLFGIVINQEQDQVDDDGDIESSSSSSYKVEQTWIIISLLILFVPIFSIEFFFAISRQLICDSGGGTLNPGNTAEGWSALYLCSPAYINDITP